MRDRNGIHISPFFPVPFPHAFPSLGWKETGKITRLDDGFFGVFGHGLGAYYPWGEQNGDLTIGAIVLEMQLSRSQK